MKVELSDEVKDKVFRHSSAGGKFFEMFAFVGDVIIDYFLRIKLFEIYNEDLKQASIEKSVLASSRCLAYLSEELKLFENLIKLGDIKPSEHLLASIFEAYCFGIYLDYGIDKVFEFLEEVLWKRKNFLIENFDDFISKLKREYPNSKIIIEKAENCFKFKLYIDDKLILETTHKNKKEGKYEIAKKFYLEKIFGQKTDEIIFRQNN